MINKNIRNIILLSSVLLLSPVLSLTSCDTPNNPSDNNNKAFNLLKTDGTTIEEVLAYNNLSLNENETYTYTSDSRNIASVLSNGAILGNNIGKTNINILNSSLDVVYSLPVEVVAPKTVEEKKTYRHSKATFSDKLSDIVIGGGNVAKHTRYEISVKVPNQTNQSLTVISSDETVLKAFEEDGKYYIYGENVGEADLLIYDVALNKMFEYTISVVKKIESDEEAREWLSTVDYFQGWGCDAGYLDGSGMKLSFPTTASGILYGNSNDIGGDVGTNTFDISFVQYGASESFGCPETYTYEILNFKQEIQFPYTLQYLDVSETKDMLRLHSTNIIVDFFSPMSN